MPWKECHVMDERLRFVARLLEGEKMTALCAEFGISRKTGYKIYDRYKDCGVVGLSDRSRRPQRQANQLPPPVEARIVRLKREYPGWGAPKIREKLRQQVPDAALPGDQHGACRARSPRAGAPAAAAPAARDGTALTRPGRAKCPLVRRLQRRIHARQSALLLSADDHRFREPLSAHLRGVGDARPRNLPSPSSSAPSRSSACRAAIRTDNGVPFASANALYGLSKLRSGGCGWGLRSSASSPGIPSRTAATSACI